MEYYNDAWKLLATRAGKLLRPQVVSHDKAEEQRPLACIL